MILTKARLRNRIAAYYPQANKGACRLTSHATMAVLAQAHGMGPNDYLQKLAEALPP